MLDLLVTGDGRDLAVVAADGTPRMLRRRTGDFIREVLAESSGFDGDPAELEKAAFAICSRDSCVANLLSDGGAWGLLATRSSVSIDWAELVRACSRSDIVVSDRCLPRACEPRWLKLDRKMLEQSGGVAIFLGRRPRVETVAERIGQHPWAAARK